MLKRILVPIDGTEYSWRALEYASALARLSSGSLVVMTVSKKDTPVPIVFTGEDCLVAQIGNEVLDVARAIMSGQGVECSYLLEQDSSITESILHTEKVEKCDTIVLGSRGFGTLEGLFKGSVSQVIVESAQVPVIVVK